MRNEPRSRPITNHAAMGAAPPSAGNRGPGSNRAENNEVGWTSSDDGC